MSSKTSSGLSRLKAAIKARLKQGRLWYVRRFRSFDRAALEGALGAVGIRPGDVVFVHSSYDAFTGFTGKPTDVLAALQAAVGEDGTILMPSMPFTGTAVEYLARGKPTDIKRTPSRMGILTEVLRRQSGTLRSMHPTHPVLAVGRQAAEMIEGHELAGTPCGRPSPYSKLLDHDGKVLFLGTSIDAMTLFHFLEEEYEDEMYEAPLLKDTVDAVVRDGEREVVVTMRMFDPETSRRRRVPAMLPKLRGFSDTRNLHLGGLGIMAIKARDAERVFTELMKQRGILYEA